MIGAIDIQQIQQRGYQVDLANRVVYFRLLLLTGLTNPQVGRTAEMANVVAVCFVRGKKPQPETIALAASHKLPLLLTGLPMFESCGRLYREGVTGCSEKGT